MTRTSALFVVLLGTAVCLPAQTPPPNPSLTPPGAPADGVFKTLDQVEARIPINTQNTPGDVNTAFRISNSGSYYLTGNIEIDSGDGITISSSNVTLDLNGFTLNGDATAGGGSGGKGVVLELNMTAGIDKIVVANGIITAWGEGVGVTEPVGGAGVHIGGEAILRDLLIKGNGSGVANSVPPGFSISKFTAKHCVASNNTFSGMTCDTAHDCVAEGNGSNGISAHFIEGCEAIGNTGIGLIGTRVHDSTSNGNGTGISASEVKDCVVAGNGTGITVSSGGSVQRCHVDGNNSSKAASKGGILATDGASITDNIVRDNGGVGISASGFRNVIVNNIATENADMAANDTDYVVAAGNIVGTIVKQATTTAISGNSGGGTGGSDPFANIAD